MSGVCISESQVRRLAHEVGQELIDRRDRQAVEHRRRQLAPRTEVIPEAVVVEVDGGRIRTRAAGAGPGVHDAQNKEDKIACLATLSGPTFPADPCPEPPESFVCPRRVQRLVAAMKGQAGEADPQEIPEQPAGTTGKDVPAPPADRWSPARLVRTCVASLERSSAFGPLVAAEAHQRGFYRAKRRAFVADGLGYNWSIQHGYFADFEPIVDLLHVLCYLYRAAWAVDSQKAGRWARYAGWLRACWQGRVGAVLQELRVEQARLGEPPEGQEVGAFDPRRLVAEAVSYLGNNAERMDYPRYRRAGLPVTSSLVESLVGQVNGRVKGPEKFWNRPAAAEAILQVRAAVLSEDDRLARHFAQRPGSPYRRRKKAG
jgi:hypothetical protein